MAQKQFRLNNMFEKLAQEHYCNQRWLKKTISAQDTQWLKNRGGSKTTNKDTAVILLLRFWAVARLAKICALATSCAVEDS